MAHSRFLSVLLTSCAEGAVAGTSEAAKQELSRCACVRACLHACARAYASIQSPSPASLHAGGLRTASCARSSSPAPPPPPPARTQRTSLAARTRHRSSARPLRGHAWAHNGLCTAVTAMWQLGRAISCVIMHGGGCMVMSIRWLYLARTGPGCPKRCQRRHRPPHTPAGTLAASSCCDRTRSGWLRAAHWQAPANQCSTFEITNSRALQCIPIVYSGSSHR